MASLNGSLVLVFAVLTLLGQGFLQLFQALFYDRSWGPVLASLPVTIPWALAVTASGAVVLGLRVRPLGRYSRALAAGQDPGAGDAVYRVLATFPRFFLLSNALIFVAGTALQALVLASLGLHPYDGGSLLALSLVGLATGGMGMLQGLALSDSLLVRFRDSMGVVSLPPGFRDLSLTSKILATTIGTVFLTGILAAVSTLGFYRELTAYFLHLGADALASGTVASAEASSSNELKVVVQMGALLVLIGVWTFFLIVVVVQNLNRQLKRITAKTQELSSGSSDLHLRVPVVFFDEIGALTHHLNGFLARLQPLVAEIKADAAEASLSSARVRTEAEEASLTTVGLASS